MKKGVIAVLVIVLAAGAAGTGYFYKFYKKDAAAGNEGRISSESEDAVYVDSVRLLAGLGSGDGAIQRYAGVVEPQQTWEVKLENDRSVDQCYVKEGDEVKEGQKLFAYNTTEDQDKLEQAQIDLERLENDIESTKTSKEQLEKEKAKASSEDQLSYTQQILMAETQIKTSEYELKSKKLEIEQLKEKVADAAVYSEISGIIKSINDPNSSSSSYLSDSTADAAYITVLEIGDYRVKGTVNEQNIGQIWEGMEMLVHSRVDESLTWKGTITEIKRDKGETNSSSSYYGSSSDSSTSSTNYPYYVSLTSSDGLMLGQHVYMEQDLGQGEKKEGIWLDDYYFIIEEDNTAYVWAASAANVLEKRRVTLGEYEEDRAIYQVLEGLTEEDYITIPYEELTEGLPVIYNDYAAEGSYSMDDFGEEEYDFEDEISYEDGAFEEEISYEDDVFDDSVNGADDEFADGMDGEIYDADAQDEALEIYDADAEDEIFYEEDEQEVLNSIEEEIPEEENR